MDTFFVDAQPITHMTSTICEWPTPCRQLTGMQEYEHADGDHIHGSRGGPDFFGSGGVAGGGIYFRAGVPAVLWAAKSPAASPTDGSANGAGEDRAEALRRRGELRCWH